MPQTMPFRDYGETGLDVSHPGLGAMRLSIRADGEVDFVTQNDDSI